MAKCHIYFREAVNIFNNNRDAIRDVSAELVQITLNANGDEVYFSLNTEVKNKFLKELYYRGLLNYDKRTDKYSFPHTQDALSFVKGYYKERFIDCFIKEVFDKCKLNYRDKKLADFFNMLIYNYVEHKPGNKEQDNSRIFSFLVDWHHWLNTDFHSSSVFFQKNIGNLYSFYVYGKNYKVLTQDSIIIHFSNFISENRMFFIDNPFDLELLLFYSIILFDDRNKLIDIIDFSEDELRSLYKKSSGMTHLRTYINRKLNTNTIVQQFNNHYAKIQNEFININNYIEVNDKNIQTKYWRYLGDIYVLNNIRISVIAYYLNVLFDNNHLNHELFEASVVFFENNVKQIISKTQMPTLSRYVNIVKKVNLELYHRLMNIAEFKNHIVLYFDNDYSLESVLAMEGFYYPKVTFLIESITWWIPNVNMEIINQYLNDKQLLIDSGEFIKSENSFFHLLTHTLIKKQNSI